MPEQPFRGTGGVARARLQPSLVGTVFRRITPTERRDDSTYQWTAELRMSPGSRIRTTTACAIVLIAATLHTSRTTVAQSSPAIRLSPDFANAKAVVDLYRKGFADEADMNELLALEGTRAVIRQAGRFSNDATEERFVDGLRISVSGVEVSGPDPFEFNRIRMNLDGIERTITWIEENPDAMSSRVLALLSPYSPITEPLEIKYFVVVGGNSDGWASDDVFHIALQYFGDDVEGMLTLLSHEVYHVVQSNFMAPAAHEEGTRHSRVEQLLQATIREGMASYVSNPLNTEGGGAYTEWFSRKYRRNLNHLAVNFDLLETVVFRAYHDPSASLGALYAIGFSGALESPAYFVGFEMARLLEEVGGRAELLNVLRQPAAEFFAQYFLIADEGQRDVIRFSDSFREIVTAVREGSDR
jgi:hypothetical protein